LVLLLNWPFPSSPPYPRRQFARDSVPLGTPTLVVGPTVTSWSSHTIFALVPPQPGFADYDNSVTSQFLGSKHHKKKPQTPFSKMIGGPEPRSNPILRTNQLFCGPHLRPECPPVFHLQPTASRFRFSALGPVCITPHLAFVGIGVVGQRPPTCSLETTLKHLPFVPPQQAVTNPPALPPYFRRMGVNAGMQWDCKTRFNGLAQPPPNCRRNLRTETMKSALLWVFPRAKPPLARSPHDFTDLLIFSPAFEATPTFARVL